MEGNVLHLVHISLVEPLLMRRALLHLEQNSLEGGDSRVRVLLLNACLLEGLLLLDADVIALYLLLKVLRVEVLYGIDHVLLHLFQFFDRVHLRDRGHMDVRLNWRNVLVLEVEKAVLAVQL